MNEESIKEEYAKIQFDENCVTLPDGSCVSEKECMHGPGIYTSAVDYKIDKFAYIVRQQLDEFNVYNATITYSPQLNQWLVYEFSTIWI